MMERIVKGRLIYLINDTQGLLFKSLAFYVVDLTNGERELIGKLPTCAKKKALSCFRLTERLFRLEPKCAARLDEYRFVVCVLSKLWVLDVQKRSVIKLIEMRHGYSVLNFCERDGFVYWGDYGANPNHDEINIYRLDRDLNISIVYTFPRNSIRHIHGIIKDGDGFIVMVGDNESQAGIYRVNGDWAEVKPWKTGEQKYRAVVGFPFDGGLLYATDSVESENHLRLIGAEGDERDLVTINGSCIYGCETKDYFIFSTTVESHEGGGWRKLLSNELGGGIKSLYVHIIAVGKSDLNIRILKKSRKDIWPIKLFQYGMAVFPKRQEKSIDGVWFYNIATKKNDGKTLYLKFDEQDW